MSGVIESVALILEVAVVWVILCNLFEKHLKIDAYTIVLIIAYWFLLSEINKGEFPTYMAFLSHVFIFIYSIFEYKKSIIVTLMNCFLSFIIISFLQLIFCIPVHYLYYRVINITGLNSLLINTASLFTVIAIKNKVRLKKISDFIQERRWIIKLSFTIVIMYLFINMLHVKISNTIINAAYIQIIFIIFVFFLVINEWQKAIVDAERKKTQLEMNALYYDAYDELILLIRERQHDMKNHISAILGMIYTIDNYEELVESQKKYCDDVVEKNKETKLLLSIGNPLIAGFLYRKFQEAQKLEITVDCKVVSKEDNYFLPEYELIEILGILIDNAVEALRKKEITEKRIYVEIDDKDKEFQILVANISEYYGPGEVSKFFQKDYTSKGKGHGIGLKKLKKIVQEKGGDIKVTNEKIDGNNYLQFGVILQKMDRHS